MNANAMAISTIEEAMERLKVLNGQINRKVRGTMRANMSGTEHSYTRLDSVRNLTVSEWEETITLIQRYELPCELGSTGFTWAISVYGHSPIPEHAPDRVLWITSRQVPLPGTLKDHESQEEVLKNLTWLTHSPRNRELLQWYGLDQPQDPSHYMY